jgi:RimJ/RimL family protein N-acetyltransferase
VAVSRTNEHGQPVGDPLAWSPRPRPGRVRLDGRQVTLEPVTGAHVSDLHAHLALPAHEPLWTYRPDTRPADLGDTARRVAEWAGSDESLTWAVVPAATGEASGVVSWQRIDPANGSVEVAAVLFGPALQRTPAATEAIALLAAHAFEDLGYRRLEWKLDHLNAPSAAAARRLGFTYEGRFRNALVYKGRSRDTDWFAMTDDDWRALRPAYDAWLAAENFDADGRQRSRLSDLTGAALPRP